MSGKNLLAFGLTSLLTGTGSALFLAGMAWVISRPEQDARWFLLAPVVGLVTGLVYERSNRWFPQINKAQLILLAHLKRPFDFDVLPPLPRAMAPLVVLFTWLSHLAGLSVGREGTAFQMGGGIAWVIRDGMKIDHGRDLLLKCGVAAGFGSVFGVPLAGAVFAYEISNEISSKISNEISQKSVSGLRQKNSFWQIIMCAVCAWIADQVARGLGASHLVASPWQSGWGFLYPTSVIAWSLVGVGCGLAAWVFLFCLAHCRMVFHRIVPSPWLRPMVFGVVYSLLLMSLPALRRYAGLGTQLIDLARHGEAQWFDWLGKAVLTSASVASGFRGGEVTPLMSIGASLAVPLGALTELPISDLISIASIAVFGAAAGVPITAAVMSMELVGLIPAAVALPVCLLASYSCRHRRLYDEGLE